MKNPRKMDPLVFIRRSYHVEDDSNSPFPLPKNIRRTDIPNIIGTSSDSYNHYVCSWKVDGIRKHLLFLDNKVLLIDRKDEIIDITDTVSNHNHLDGTMFDCEFIDGILLIFDLVIVRHNSKIGELPYHHRHQIATAVLTQFDHNHLRMKPIYQLDGYHERDCEWKTDGVIFTPVHQFVYVTDLPIYKWKPLHEHTVDFLVSGRCLLDGSGQYYAQLDRDLPNDTVWECRFTNYQWQPIRQRDDKTRGNSRFVIDSTLESQHENILLSELLIK